MGSFSWSTLCPSLAVTDARAVRKKGCGAISCSKNHFKRERESVCIERKESGPGVAQKKKRDTLKAPKWDLGLTFLTTPHSFLPASVCVHSPSR